RPLYHLGLCLFEKHNFSKLYQIDPKTLKAFLTTMEEGYRDNPYHNSTHAADVMHAIHHFAVGLGLYQLVTVDDCFAGVLAAIIHDLDHPGVNNAFLINTEAPLAVRYNDQSVLENYHCAHAFEILTNTDTCNVLSKLPPEKFKQLRASMMSMVLATDMAGHFEYIAKFKNKISGSGMDFTDAKDRQLLMDIAMKCADISNPAKATELSVKWTANIMEEFFRQGDEERRLGLPVSMFMDRNNTVISKCQVGFIDYIVSPLYEVWDTYMNEDQKFSGLTNLSKNREYWKKQLEVDIVIAQ
ncbi:High affinity cAMP-specific 3',5'-cyclic phosphodiesterase 7A, partial [Quaeritorhiza haematococci]